MDTLSNDVDRRGGIKPQDAAPADACINSGASEKVPGVSVDYAPCADHRWYVLRATYGRAARAADHILQAHSQATLYLPLQHIVRQHEGRKERISRPILPSILFVYATPPQVDQYIHHTPHVNYLSYYYNHFATAPGGHNPPLVVPYDHMMNFIRATRVDSDHLLLVDPQEATLKCGEHVRIIDGPFRGVEGRVARIARQQRVVVQLLDLCCIATAYIPSAFLQRIGNSE